MKVLVSGFEPFNNSGLNPSEEIVKMLPDKIGEAEIVKAYLPVSYFHSFDELRKIIDKVHPDAVICLGLANGRKAITPERIAINMNSASIADNDGVKYIDDPIRRDGKCAYFSTLPIREMVEAMSEVVPATISNTAGTYVCNNIMFKVLEYVDHNCKAGFIHVPMMKGMKNDKDFYELEIEKMTEAIIKAIEVIV